MRLAFEAGVVDGPGKSDGVLFGVQIDGVTLWRQNVQPGKWQPGSIDLTPYAGKTVTVRYLTNAGPQQNARFDWPCWGSLNLETSFDIPSVSLAITLPAGGKIRGLSDGATLDEGAAAGSAAIRTALPARVTVFAEEPPAIALGESLLDFPYEVWKSSYEGLPFPFSVEDSGNIDAARSGGVTRAKTLIAVPPRNGFTIITSAVRIPQDANTLEVEYGLIDPPASYGPDFEYSGAEFSLQINGKSVFAEEIRTAGWRARRVPVDSYRGKRVLIQFKVDAQKLSLYDWARWTNLTVR